MLAWIERVAEVLTLAIEVNWRIILGFVEEIVEKGTKTSALLKSGDIRVASDPVYFAIESMFH